MFKITQLDNRMIFGLSFCQCIIKSPVVEHHINIGEGLVLPGEPQVIIAEIVFGIKLVESGQLYPWVNCKASGNCKQIYIFTNRGSPHLIKIEPVKLCKQAEMG